MAEPAALVLGSASPRRSAMLGALGVKLEVQPVDVDEVAAGGTGDAAERAHRIATVKLDALARLATRPEVRLLTADTLVAHAGSVLGKPVDARAAERMVLAMSGAELEIVTAVCVAEPQVAGTRLRRSGARHTRVRLRELGAAEVADYVATGEALDKAGGLSLQGAARPFVAAIDGCWSNVVGLPVCLVSRLIGLGARPCSGERCGRGQHEPDR